MTMIFRYIPKRLNKPKNDSQSLDRSNEFSAISSATSQERSSREKIWEAPDRYGTSVSSLEAKRLVCKALGRMSQVIRTKTMNQIIFVVL